LLGIFSGTARRTETARWTPGPIIAAVEPKDRADPDDHSKEHGLNRSWHYEYGLRPTVPQGRMGKVEERRPPFGTCVYDLEHGLKIPI